MDHRSEVREFLTSRRARLTPEQVGLSADGGVRRVPGLRREEVALLAGVSVDYYTRVERGNLRGVSDNVLNSVARALCMEQQERRYLFALARAAGSAGDRAARRSPAPVLRAGIRAVVDGLTGIPVTVSDSRMQMIATNALGRALYAPLFDTPGEVANHAKFMFLDPRARRFWVDWEVLTVEAVGTLRNAVARDPYDKDLSDLIGELAVHSDRFRKLWGSQDVFVHRDGLMRIDHPVVGRVDLVYEVLRLESEIELAMLAFSAEPGSASHDALKLLASWMSTPNVDVPITYRHT
jgi:transcriptional regulator with XRE-family HTH domain